MADTIPFVVPRARFADQNLDPLTGGRVTFYAAGESTPKEVYSDNTTDTQAPNPHILDAGGWVQDGGVWLGSGDYKVKVEASLSNDEDYLVVDGNSITNVDGQYTKESAPDANGNDVWKHDSQSIYLSYYYQVDGVTPAGYVIAAAINEDNPADQYGTLSNTTLPIGTWVQPVQQTYFGVGYADYYEIWTMDNIPGQDTPASGLLTSAYAETIDDLRNLDDGAYGLVYVAGYYSKGDGGEGWFYWDANEGTADNSGTIIAPISAPSFGRWIRIFNGELVTPNVFGATPGYASSVNSNLDSMIDWCDANQEHRHIRFPAGEYGINQNWATLSTDDVFIEFEEGAKFVAIDSATGLTLTLNNAEVQIHGALPIADFDDITPTIAPQIQIEIRPEWLGAVGDGATDDYDAFVRGFNANAKFLLNGGTSYIFTGAAPGTFSVDSFHFESGASITIGNPDHIFNIDSIRVDDEASPVFKTYINGVRIGTSVYKASWFDLDLGTGTIVAALWERLFEAASSDRTTYRTIVFDSNEEYLFSGTPSTPQTETYVNIDVKPGTAFDLENYEIPFGTIVSGPWKIFSWDAGDTGLPILSSGIIRPQWFGARGNQTSGQDGFNDESIAKSLATQEASSVSASIYSNNRYITDMVIDGNGETFWFRNGVTYAVTSDRLGMKMQNMTLAARSGFSGSALLVQTGGCVNLKDVDFVAKDATICLDVTGSATYDTDMMLSGCKMESSGVALDIDGMTNVHLNGCNIEANLQVAAVDVDYMDLVGNSFNGVGGSGIDALNLSVGRLNIAGNIFSAYRGTSIPSSQAELHFTGDNIAFTGNTIESFETYFWNNAGWNGLVISGNQFLNSILDIRDPSNFTITGNNFGQSDGTSAIVTNIHLTGTAPGHEIDAGVITGNVFLGESGTTTEDIPFLTNIATDSNSVTFSGNAYVGSFSDVHETTASGTYVIDTAELTAGLVGGVYGNVIIDISDIATINWDTLPLKTFKVISTDNLGNTFEGSVFSKSTLLDAPSGGSPQTLPLIWCDIGDTDAVLGNLNPPYSVQIIDITTSSSDASVKWS